MPTRPKGSIRTGNDRLGIPPGLSDGAAAIFKNIVASVDVSHFADCDLPLIVQYAGAAELAARAQEHLDEHGAVIDGKASPWLTVLEKASRSCVALAARLRLCPQSRFDRLVAGANSRKQHTGRKPWEPADPAARFFGEDE